MGYKEKYDAAKKRAEFLTTSRQVAMSVQAKPMNKEAKEDTMATLF